MNVRDETKAEAKKENIVIIRENPDKKSWHKLDLLHPYAKAFLTLILALTIPLTIFQVFKQQDVRQQAATPTYKVGNLPEFTGLLDLEQKLLATTKGEWRITPEDYALCPNETPGQPGSLNATEARARAKEYTGNSDGGGDCSDGDGQDLWFYFGKVSNSSGNDIFFTDTPANVEARFAGSCQHNSAHCHDRGCMYYAVDGPSHAMAGGWEYKHDQDKACFAISTWSCARSGWSKVMGYAQRQVGNRYRDTKQLMDRRCALSLAVMEVREDCRRNHNEDCPNPESLGFTVPSGSVSQSPAATKLITSGTDDKAQCATITPFTDIPASDSCLSKAAAALSTPEACTVRGYGNGILSPSNPLERADALAFITRFHVYVAKDWKYIDTNTLSSDKLFTDVPKDHPHALSIYTAVANGFADVTPGKAFSPNDPWQYGAKGISKAEFNNFSKTEASITRGDLIKALYGYAVQNKYLSGEACSSSSPTASGSATLKDPTPFAESTVDIETRTKVCGDKASLLSGHIASTPSVRIFKDKLYVFARGREDKLYVRTFNPKLTPEGKLTDLETSPWFDFNKTIGEGDIVTYLQDSEGLPSLSVLTQGKEEKKVLISSTTNGTSWTNWITNTISFDAKKMLADVSVSYNNTTYSFSKGDENSENNLCLTIASVPSVTSSSKTPSLVGLTSDKSSSKLLTSSEGQVDAFKACVANCLESKDEVRTQNYCEATVCKDYAKATPPQQNPLQQLFAWLGGLF